MTAVTVPAVVAAPRTYASVTLLAFVTVKVLLTDAPVTTPSVAGLHPASLGPTVTAETAATVATTELEIVETVVPSPNWYVAEAAFTIDVPPAVLALDPPAVIMTASAIAGAVKQSTAIDHGTPT